MQKANLFIIGAQKSGTTSLYEYLRQHSEITFSRVKELTHFIDPLQYRLGDSAFHAYFPRNPATEILATSHVHMLSCIDAPKRIQAYNSRMRFIVVMRNPVERAWSAYRYAVANGWEPFVHDFAVALDKEAERYESGDHRAMYDLAYVNNGMYARHLTHWMNYFDSSQFLLLRTVDLRDGPQSVLDRVCSFLDISPERITNWSRQYNVAREFRWRWLGQLMLSRDSVAKSTLRTLVPERARIWMKSRIFPAINRLNTVQLEATSMPESVIERLESAFASDLCVLRDEFGIDLLDSPTRTMN